MPSGIYKHKLKYNISKQFFIQEYNKNIKTLDNIAKDVGCSRIVIRDRLKKYNIRIRTKSEARKQISILRDDNPAKRLEVREKLSKKMKGNKNGLKDGHTLQKNFCIDCGKEIKWWAKRCHKCAMIDRIKLGIYNFKPNKPEKQLNNLLQNLLSHEYKYVGNGEFWIVGFNPDFINCNGQKKIIELFGDYWHNRKDAKKRDKLRLRTYKKYGYETLIIWEHELKQLDELEQRILIFNNKENSKTK